MAKNKKRNLTSGPTKNHGPKRKLFKEFKPMIHALAKYGLLNKYNNYESWVIACQARGKKSTSIGEFKNFEKLDRAAQDEYFANISNASKAK